MSKDLCGLCSLSTNKSAMTKVKARYHVNFMSNLNQHKLGHHENGEMVCLEYN